MMPTAPRVHKGHQQRRPRVLRLSAAQRGYNSRWAKVRKAFLNANPVCFQCGHTGNFSDMVVDHVIPHRGDDRKFWDHDNLQTLCKWCHNSKSARGQ